MTRWHPANGGAGETPAPTVKVRMGRNGDDMEFVPPFGLARARELMRYASDISEKGLGLTSPNPIVGALFVNDAGDILAEGFHQGSDHAEVVALKNLKSNSENLTAIITLEPCNHFGKTPPCSEALLKAGIKNLIFAVSDPNPIAQGGAEKLIMAGVKVLAGIEKEYVEKSNQDWLFRSEEHTSELQSH